MGGADRFLGQSQFWTFFIQSNIMMNISVEIREKKKRLIDSMELKEITIEGENKNHVLTVRLDACGLTSIPVGAGRRVVPLYAIEFISGGRPEKYKDTDDRTIIDRLIIENAMEKGLNGHALLEALVQSISNAIVRGPVFAQALSMVEQTTLQSTSTGASAPVARLRI